ncbi:serine/threonine-protein kinase [Kitasatospora mediocidica]|uniref:serine/threonine-protein kinase n=1 Tax=Kitasatospora mediocidica TaxID=58352 RepID=UPI0006904219|nr:serine/threonine-protein kinase [Kitasatospora mediocidica]
MKALQDGDPRRVGPYELLGVLGAGGMGRVYLGRRDELVVAVKVINEELTQNTEFIARFRREVTATQAVSGPYVAAVVDHDVDAEQPWLATEYVPGPTLNAVVAEHGCLGTVPVRALGVRLAEALGAIHAAGLVHRDVKPGNILLGPDGPRLIDFGIARGAAVTTLTQTGVVLGTPQFMAPEQLQARGRVGPAADVFALGLVLAFAATGKHPFGQTDSFGFGFRIVYEEPNLEGIPAELVDLVGRCLAKDPEERPTPEELVTALGLGEATLDQTGLGALIRHAGDTALPTATPTPTPTATPTATPTEPNSAGRPTRRRPAVIALAAVVVVGMVITVVLGLGGGAPASTQGQGLPSGSPAGPSATGTPTAPASSAAPSNSPPPSPPSPAPPSTAAPATATSAPAAGPSGSGGGGGSSTTGGTSGGTTTGSRGTGGGSASTTGGTSGGTSGGTTGGGSATTPAPPPPSPAPLPPPSPAPPPAPPPSPQGSPPSAMQGFNANYNNACFGSCYMPLTLSWPAKPDATRYDIQYSDQTTNASAVYSTAGTSYTINGPVSGDHICVALRAANQHGASAWTQTYCFDTPY